VTDQRALLNRLPRSCIRNQISRELAQRTKIVLAFLAIIDSVERHSSRLMPVSVPED